MPILFIMSSTGDLVYEHQRRSGLWLSATARWVLGSPDSPWQKSICRWCINGPNIPDIFSDWRKYKKLINILGAGGHVDTLPQGNVLKLPAVINNIKVMELNIYFLSFSASWATNITEILHNIEIEVKYLKQTGQMFRYSIV